MASNVAEIVLLISGKDQASGALGGISGKLNKIGTASGVAAVAIGAGLLKIGNDYDQMTDLIARGTGATGEALDELNSTATDVFKSMPISMETAGTAVADLNTRLGLTGEALGDVAAQFIDFSRVADTEVATSIRDVTRVMGDWGVSVDDTSILLDKLFLGSQATGITVEKLNTTLVAFGAPLRAMGFSLDESIALLGKWEKEGVNSELVLGALKLSMAKFAKAGVPMREGLDDIIARITELGPGAAATTLAMETFGQRAGGDMAAAILEGRFAIEDLVGVIEGAEGAVASTKAEMDDWRQTLKILKNNVIGMVAPHADMAGAILSAGGSVAIMAANMGRAAPAMKAMGPAMMVAANGSKALGLALLTPPLGIVIALIAVGVAAYIFRDEIAGAFQSMLNFVLPIIDTVTGKLGGVVSWVTDNWPLLVALLAGPVGLAVFAVVKHWDAIAGKITGGVDAVLGFLRDNWPEIVTLISGPFFPLVALATDAFGIRSALTDALDAMLAKTGEIIGGITAFMIALPGEILTALGDLTNTLKQKGQDLIAGFIKGMLSIPIPNPLSLVPGGGAVTGVVSSTLSTVGGWVGYAAGGPVSRGQAILVGEEGPEFFVPNQSGQIIPNGGGAGGGLNLTLNGDVNVYPTREARTPRGTLADVAFAAVAELHARGMMVAA